MRLLIVAFLFTVTSLSAPAAAYDAPAIEAFFGASNITAVTGNGRLTAAVSPEGDLSVLSWPSPSYFDHLQYVASNQKEVRNLRRAGALNGMGIHSGLVLEFDSGSQEVTWLNDLSSWSAGTSYSAVDGLVVETRFENPDVGLIVVQRDFVWNSRDVLYRHYEVELTPGSDIVSVGLLGYSNLSPSQTKLAEMPIADFAFEQHQDFAAVWDELATAVVHFHPADNGTMTSPLGIARIVENMRRDFGALGTLLRQPTVNDGDLAEVVATLDQQFGPGVYIAHSSSPPPEQFQIGYDTTPVCDQIDLLADNITALLDSGANPGFTIPSSVVGILRCGSFAPLDTPREENEWLHDAMDAWHDAADGELFGGRIAAAQANTALRVPVQIADGRGEATLLYAFGETHAEAISLLDEARATDAATAGAEVDANAAEWASDLVLPEDLSDDYRAFLLRALLNLWVGTDADSGAIVASISRQPSYHVDWPRDGVFFNVALDLAGKHDLVEKRLAFYASTMRTEPARATAIINEPPPGWPDDPSADDFPPGSWEMNYYADGVRSGNIRLEIDNTALLVWNFAEHAGWLDDEAERLAFLQESWPTVRVAADWLASWRDPETGLIWPSNEDDHIEYTQGIQGNGTAFVALEAAAMMALALGHDADAERYVERARELHRAILTHLWDREAKRFFGQPEWSVRTEANPTAWIGWPIRILPWTNEDLRDQISEMVSLRAASVRGETPRGQYPTKAATSAALMFPGEPEAELADEIARTLATEIASPGTKMLGEVFVNDDTDGDGTIDRRLNVQGNPHLWSAILVYITARALDAPEEFDRYRAVLPAVNVRGDFPKPPAAERDAGSPIDAGAPDAGLPVVPDMDTRPLDELVVQGSSCDCATTRAPTATFWLLLAIAGLTPVTRRFRR